MENTAWGIKWQFKRNLLCCSIRSVQYVLRLHGRIKITSMMRFRGQQMRTTKGFCVCDAFQPFPPLGLCGFQVGRCQPSAQQQGWKRSCAPFAQTGCRRTDPTHCLSGLKLFCSPLLFCQHAFCIPHFVKNTVLTRF